MPSASSVRPSCRSRIFFRKQGSLSGTLRTKATAPLFATAIRARPARSLWSSRKTGRASPISSPRLRPPIGTTRRCCWSRRRRRTGLSGRAASRKWSRWRCSATWSATRKKYAIPRVPRLSTSAVREGSRTSSWRHTITLNRVIAKAKRLSAPAQINIPRDFWTQVIDINLPAIVEFERPAGGARAVAEAAKLLSAAKFPVILSGAGVVLGHAIPECAALAEKLDAPVCNNYQHNDSFPGSHLLAVGPLGYNGSKAAMELVAKADVVLALGTRLNPFSTLPGYGIDYWPKTAKIIQVDINADRIGLTKPVTVGICGDAKLVAKGILAQLSPSAGDIERDARTALIHSTRSRWLQTLSSMDHEDDDPGTTWNADAVERDPDRMSPRQAWRAIQAGLPKDAIISSDIGNNCAIGNAYPIFDKGRKYLAPGLFGPCGYGFPAIIGAKIGNPDAPCVGFAGDGAFGISMNEMSSIGREQWPGITMIVFRNYQWGAEKRNSFLWYDNNFVGTELDPKLSYAKVGEGCGLKGVVARTPAELTEALRKSCQDQKERITTFVEVILNQELGEPFRRDAMKKPVMVAGIKREDMRSQVVA